jgi:predicted GIY-YIG superfamily endonuclease
MPIDDCSSGFIELATTVLPKYMGELRRDMEARRPLGDFCASGVGVKTIAGKLGKQSDFSGCYVLRRDGKPFYVGISRGVIGRLRQHGTGKTHFDASLAYRMACEKVPHKMTRSAAMADSVFRSAFEKARELLMGSSVAFVEIRNDLELYLFEAYCAMELDTYEWNTFRTH